MSAGLQISTVTRRRTDADETVAGGVAYLLYVVASILLILLFASPALVIAAWRWAL